MKILIIFQCLEFDWLNLVSMVASLNFLRRFFTSLLSLLKIVRFSGELDLDKFLRAFRFFLMRLSSSLGISGAFLFSL